MFLVSDKFVYYSRKDKKKLSNLLNMEEVEIDPCAILLVHGFLQHAEGG